MQLSRAKPGNPASEIYNFLFQKHDRQSDASVSLISLTVPSARHIIRHNITGTPLALCNMSTSTLYSFCSLSFTPHYYYVSTTFLEMSQPDCPIHTQTRIILTLQLDCHLLIVCPATTSIIQLSTSDTLDVEDLPHSLTGMLHTICLHRRDGHWQSRLQI